MISAPAYTIKGEKGKAVALPAKVFGVEANPALLAAAVRVYLGNQRRALAKTKTRSGVAGSTRKIWKQKGTGRARHGSIRAPIFVGGGVAHGPTGKQNYRRQLPQSMRRLALLGALSAKAADKRVLVLADPDKSSGKTGQVAWMADGASLLVISTPTLDKFNRSVRNLYRVDVAHANNLSAYQVLAHQRLVVAAPALETLAQTYAA